jgi:hypothetical protein
MTFRKLALSIAFTVLAATGAFAASPDQEKAFVTAYQTAFDAQNADGLSALLFTDGAIPMAVDFYKMSMTADFGKKISSIELQDLTADDVAKASSVITGPDGSKAVLVPKPYKKLVIKIDTSDASGTSSSESEIFVAEKDGKIGIAMPAPAK